MKYSILVFIVALLGISSAFAGSETEADLLGYLVGTYHLIGKAYESDDTYYGSVVLEKQGNHLNVTRNIAGNIAVGTGKIIFVTAAKMVGLQIDFKEKGEVFEEICVFGSDFNNNARITCYVGKPGVKRVNPGMEALFIDDSAFWESLKNRR